MLKDSCNIVKYICQNNKFWQIPLRLCQALYWQIEKRLFYCIKSKTLFNGKQIFLYPNTPSSSCLVYTKIPDEVAITKLRSLSDEKTIFLDIGANIGLYSLCLIDKVSKVYAFEAHPRTAQLLKMNFLLNQLPIEHIEQKAVADKIGQLSFTDFSDGSPINAISEDTKNTVHVESISLDAFIQNNNFSKQNNFILKLDVEGAEHLVLEGARNLLTEYNVRAILFETFSEYSDKIIALLEALQYTINPIMDNNILAVREDV